MAKLGGGHAARAPALAREVGAAAAAAIGRVPGLEAIASARNADISSRTSQENVVWT